MSLLPAILILIGLIRYHHSIVPPARSAEKIAGTLAIAYSGISNMRGMISAAQPLYTDPGILVGLHCKLGAADLTRQLLSPCNYLLFCS